MRHYNLTLYFEKKNIHRKLVSESWIILEKLKHSKTYYFLQFELATFDDLNRGFQKDSDF